MNRPNIEVFLIRQEAFLFLGVENEIKGSIENADFVCRGNTTVNLHRII